MRFHLLLNAIAVTAGIAMAGTCPTPITPGAPACTITGGSTLSNFRATASATGGATITPNYAEAGDNATLYSFIPDVGVGPLGTLYTPPSPGTVTMQYEFTLTAAPGLLLNSVTNALGPDAYLTINSADPGDSVDIYVCVGGTFSSFPQPGSAPSAGSCSGTITTAPKLSNTESFTAASSVDVYVSVYIQGNTTILSASVGFSTVAAPAPPGTTLPFNQFVIFGDSLSDNGNLYIGTSALGFPTPGPPQYTQGEFTDGPDSVPATTAPLGLWVEQLAQKMSLPAPVPFIGKTGGLNYAVGGAITGHNPAYTLGSTTQIPGSTDQLNLFLEAHSTPPADALYLFWCGSNDILNNPGTAMTEATAAAANIQSNIDTLASKGAKYFVWVNLAPLGLIPEAYNTSNSPVFDAAAVAYNQAMSLALATLKAAHPGITIVEVDAYSLFLSIAVNPALFGYTNITSAAQGQAAVNPNTYVFWDQLHPTTVGHQNVMELAYYDIESAFGGPAYSCTNSAAPMITSIDSASAYGGFSYFSAGSWLEIKGANLADPNDPRIYTNGGNWAGADFAGVNAPSALDGISVSIDGKPAYVDYISPTQVNVQAPEDGATGDVAISLTNCKATSTQFTFSKQGLAPGLLAPAVFNLGGKQYMVATFASDGAYVLNTSTGAGFGLNSRPAKTGDVILAYGVGFGDVTPSILPGAIAQQQNALNNAVKFSFGSTPAATSYAGLAGNFVGLYEFYITVPAGLPGGDVQINVTQNGIALPQTLYLTVQN